MQRDFPFSRMSHPVQQQIRVVLQWEVMVMVENVSKVGKEKISEVVEAGEMVMQVKENCIQARRLPVKMTRLVYAFVGKTKAEVCDTVILITILVCD